MTEKEKMQSGQLYAADTDPELIADRAACKDKCWAYNQMRYTDWDSRNALLRELLGSTGERFCIEQPFWCDYGYGISIGENFYMNHGCVILDGGGITFGDNVVIGAGSLVNRDIPSGVVAAGNPCRVLRPITEEDKKKLV